MQSAEVRHSRKALAALVGFVARGRATGPLPGKAASRSSGSARMTLVREDGSQRTVDAVLLKLALERGLVSDKMLPMEPAQPTGEGEGRTMRSYELTQEGHAALKRLLCDPDTAFQEQHRTLLKRTDPEQGQMVINAQESPLAALARIKGKGGTLFLDPSHFDAGERLRADFTRGQMQPSLGQRWEPVSRGRQSGMPGGAADLTEAALSARLRVDRALADVGPELSGVLLDVCCFLKRLSDVERERQWPARSAKLMLRTALAALARHYSQPKGKSVRPQPVPPPHAP